MVLAVIACLVTHPLKWVFHNKIRKETHPSLVGERNCASYDVVIVVDSGQFSVTDRVG